MKSQSQIAVIALITLVTMALAMSVALICIANLNTKTEAEAPSDEPPPSEAPPEDTLLPEGTSPKEEEPTPVPEEPPTDSLRFLSNGNGTCVLAGIGSYENPSLVIPPFSALGDRVVSIAPMAFYGSENITAVQIPATVMEIGALAFADCPNLVYVSVNSENPFFCDLDGVLYSADESTLLLYPAKRSGSEMAISAATVRIADMAFYRCAYLSLVRYAGTAEQWEQIRIGSKNYSLTAAAKEFADQI